MAKRKRQEHFQIAIKKEEPEIWQGSIVLFLEAILEKRAERT
jgi:hypothetical protein